MPVRLRAASRGALNELLLYACRYIDRSRAHATPQTAQDTDFMYIETQSYIRYGTIVTRCIHPLYTEYITDKDSSCRLTVREVLLVRALRRPLSAASLPISWLR
jgi:hypothetical protein